MNKISHILAMVGIAFLVSRGPLLTDSFVLGCGFVAQRVFSNSKNIYLLLPVIGGVATQFIKGMQPWGYIASMVICAIIFSVFGKEKMKLWQVAVVAGSIVITCVSIYSLVFGEVYKINPAELLFEGGITVASVYIFDNIFPAKRCGLKLKRSNQQEQKLTAIVFVGLAMIHGADLDFIIWIAIIFMALWVLITWDYKTALSLTVSTSIGAALMGESQWGIMVTVMVAIFVASYVKRNGVVTTALCFAIICWCLGRVESGVVLGVDTYGLAIAVLAFLTIYWRFGKKRLLRVDIAVKQKSAAEIAGKTGMSSDNGDGFGWEEVGDNKIALLISDGMGKGARAATESALVTKTMLKFLRQGIQIEEAIELINSIMLMKNENDSYATLDLVTIDKSSGKTKFYKVGAAPSLIKKRGKLETIEMAGVPLGIVNDLKICHTETTLRKGDKIIMMSDGVSDTGLKGLIKVIKNTDCNVGSHKSSTATCICEKIMEKVSGLYQVKEGDDCTVMVARIL